MKAKPRAKENFQDAILAQPVDVEELGKQGRRKGLCPYYTARSAVPDAQLVLLPYSALLAQVSQAPSPPQSMLSALLPMFGSSPHACHAVACQEVAWLRSVIHHHLSILLALLPVFQSNPHPCHAVACQEERWTLGMLRPMSSPYVMLP